MGNMATDLKFIYPIEEKSPMLISRGVPITLLLAPIIAPSRTELSIIVSPWVRQSCTVEFVTAVLAPDLRVDRQQTLRFSPLDQCSMEGSPSSQ